ncbi:hypothetical protein CHELA1G11_12027 [Hyphomicrobiales bacterium]|nr:hypothetical protein CHELA1G11_12027 [Hyphomicrobiales bacterium]CAH1663795.1 hypothetical protein CHELA1G2_12284 [Hyphomicrobiales bacterium]
MSEIRKWRPISSAPKDGTYILVMNGPKDGVGTVAYHVGLACWCEGLGSERGRWASVDGYGEGVEYEPTHWMPRPGVDDIAMPIERAIEIVKAICEHGFHAMGLSKSVGSLEGVSLLEMVEAARLVKAENDQPGVEGSRTIHVVPDDRLIAAAYALANYQPSGGAIVSAPAAEGLINALAIIRITAAPQQGGEFV